MSRPVDHRADLYSLGATFYEMLTGRPPFSSPDPAELVHAHLARAPVPPTDSNPTVPKIINDLVLRLLEKMPEQRYQSAEALVADLLRVERMVRGACPIAGFELGRIDHERDLVIRDRLYGREPEIAEIRRAFERASGGTSELVFVVGAPGVGKSALVREVLSSPALRGAHRLCAKFDVLRANVPYAPIIDAVRDLSRALGSEPAAVVDAWRSRLRSALGPTAAVVIEAIPELADLLGARAPSDAGRRSASPADEGSAVAERRFPLALRSVVQAFAENESPLVVFLDDLQWADAASMRLLSLLAAPEAHHLLVIGAYRSDEVGPEQPLSRALDTVTKTGVPVTSIELSPLDLDMLTSFTADALRCSHERARPLSAVVLQKTAGNPLFVERFLRHLQRSGLLVFDRERGTWDWDEQQIALAGVTENVVDLMVAAIRRLPCGTQRLLRMAACLPGRIDLCVLAAMDGARPSDTATLLWSALREGLLVPEIVSSHAGPHRDGPAAAGSAVYRFVHDRVQQAAYSMLSDEERKRLHLAAGWKLLEGAASGERLLDAVDQIDRGAELLGDGEPRRAVAELNLRAARMAKASSAFGRFDVQREPVDLAKVVRDAIDRLSPQLALARCPISLRADRPVVGLWDRSRLTQVATNLLTNATKFGRGKPIEVVVEEQGGVARLVVQDHGIGIEPSRLPRVFDRFERGVSVEHYGGLGLGLYIVREIVQPLGGAVRVESEVGAGSRFFVELPSG